MRLCRNVPVRRKYIPMTANMCLPVPRVGVDTVDMVVNAICCHLQPPTSTTPSWAQIRCAAHHLVVDPEITLHMRDYFLYLYLLFTAFPAISSLMLAKISDDIRYDSIHLQSCCKVPCAIPSMAKRRKRGALTQTGGVKKAGPRHGGLGPPPIN